MDERRSDTGVGPIGAAIGFRTGVHQHYFIDATSTLAVSAGDTLFASVYLDPANPPREIMLQWYDGNFKHRAYWGENLISWLGVAMGPLPPAGQWVRLEVPARLVNLEGRTLTGMALTLYDGRATWDRAGKFAGTGAYTWFDDAWPSGGVVVGGNFAWASASPTPASGALALQSDLAAGVHQSFVYGAAATLPVAAGDTLFAHVYLDPANPPSEVMLQWYDGVFDHRAYWGANLISWPGVAMGPLPPTGQWVRLEVPAKLVNLEGRTVSGIAFTLYDGRATWDRAGLIPAPALQAQTIDFPALAPRTLGTPPFAVGATASSGLPVAFGTLTPSVCAVDANIVTLIATGNCTVRAAQAGDATYAAAVGVDQTFAVTAPVPSGNANDALWVDDALPAGATVIGSFSWASANPTPASGTVALQSDLAGGVHQHFFYGATATLSVAAGDTLFAYVYLDPSNPPSEVMLQWYDGTFDHRAYWGANLIPWLGVAMGPLPATGQWVRLEVPAKLVGLEGHVVSGMAFTLYDGRATWDRAGRSPAPAPAGTAAQAITLSSLPDQFVGAPSVELWASASSGLPVSFASLSPGTCSIDGGKLVPRAPGVCTVRAQQNGNATYAAAAPVEQSIAIAAGVTSAMLAVPVNYAAGRTPHGIAAGDFDGDGRPDLAVANWSTGLVSVLLNTGHGTFMPAVSYVAGSGPLALATGDIDGDGKLDIAVANVLSQDVSLLLGSGAGRFATGPRIAIGRAIHAVAASRRESRRQARSRRRQRHQQRRAGAVRAGAARQRQRNVRPTARIRHGRRSHECRGEGPQR